MARGNAKAFPNIERVSVTTHSKETEPPFGYYLQLYTDGAASVAAQLLTEDLVYAPGKPPVAFGIYADELVRKAAECLLVAARHASANAGARGSVLVRSGLHFPAGPMRLGYASIGGWEQYQPPTLPRRLSCGCPVSPDRAGSQRQAAPSDRLNSADYRGLGGASCWNRTSDPHRVKVVFYR
jgi:hypothetical protein